METSYSIHRQLAKGGGRWKGVGIVRSGWRRLAVLKGGEGNDVANTKKRWASSKRPASLFLSPRPSQTPFRPQQHRVSTFGGGGVRDVFFFLFCRR